MGWGIGGWYLDPGVIRRATYRLGISRGGFFLHHDGNGIGTSGCIGVSHKNRMKQLKSILSEYKNKSDQNRIEIIVS